MKIEKVALPEKCRIICVSDIHGHADDFEKLLDKCEYDADKDFLFILGDILEKGTQNIKMIRLVKKLCRNEKAICIQGNNDTMCERMAYRDDKEKFLSRLLSRPQNTYMDMAKEIGITDFSEDFDAKRERVNESFKEELEFIRDLPFAIDTKDYIFVHAGIENRQDWENSAEVVIQNVYWWLRKEHPLSKTVVVGHFPCYNFSRSGNTNLPIIDEEKRIIDIDGGCSVKWVGQLNGFIINKDGENYSYETRFLPLVPESVVTRDYNPGRSYKYLDYEESDLEIIGKDGVFIDVRNKADGTTGRIPECCTGYWNDRLHGWINLDSFVKVNKGDKYYIYGEFGEFYIGLCENGQVGMIPKECI